MGNCFGAPDIDDDDAPKQYSWDTRADINPDVRGNTRRTTFVWFCCTYLGVLYFLKYWFFLLKQSFSLHHAVHRYRTTCSRIWMGRRWGRCQGLLKVRCLPWNVWRTAKCEFLLICFYFRHFCISLFCSFFLFLPFSWQFLANHHKQPQIPVRPHVSRQCGWLRGLHHIYRSNKQLCFHPWL